MSATATSMRAARFVAVGQPIRLDWVPTPSPRPGWVLVEVLAAGLCRTDLYLLEGKVFGSSTGPQNLTRPPLTLGHEICGRIVVLGDGVEGWSLGDRVISANDPTNVAFGSPGTTFDGGFAEFCELPAARLVRVPDGVPNALAAIAPDAITTAWTAVKQAAAVTAGQLVCVLGLGGLGMNAVRTAALLGAEVVGVDRNPASFAPAQAVGASQCAVSLSQLGLVPDVVIDFVGSAGSVHDSLEAVAPRGTVVVVGLADGSAPVDTYDLIIGEKTLRGSHGGDHSTLAQVLVELERGNLAPSVEEVPFDTLPEAYRRIQHNELAGRRLVTRPMGELPNIHTRTEKKLR